MAKNEKKKQMIVYVHKNFFEQLNILHQGMKIQNKKSGVKKVPSRNDLIIEAFEDFAKKYDLNCKVDYEDKEK